jgi:pantothenate kinase
MNWWMKRRFNFQNQFVELTTRSWYVSVSRETAKRRLIKRHLMAGIETTEKAAAARAEGNDLLNADLIVQNMICPDVTIESIDFEQVG